MLSFLAGLFTGGSNKSPAEAVGGVLDDLFTSDEEMAQIGVKKEQLSLIRAQIMQKPNLAQVALNTAEAGHRTVFVAGWRPWIGWVCGMSLFMYFVPQYALGAYMWVSVVTETGTMIPYPVDASSLFELVLAMLGMSGIRMIEKIKGKAR